MRGLPPRVVALCAGLLFAATAWAGVTGRVVGVHDGDTISVLIAGQSVRVRLAGIDAPERGQPFGSVSQIALAKRVAEREVRLVVRGRDRYGRLLARVYMNGVDVNAEQVRGGHAWVFRRFQGDANLLSLEAEAKAARRGLWRDANAAPPWSWRDRQPATREPALPR